MADSNCFVYSSLQRGYLDMFCRKINTNQVTFVPDIICVNPDMVTLICKHRDMVVISFVYHKINKTGEYSFILVVIEIDLVEINFNFYL